jgi:hypothetical protein
MANKGLLFEWFLYHLAVDSYGAIGDPRDTKTAKSKWKSSNKSNTDVVNAAKKVLDQLAVKNKISKVTKMSGGKEPKTDLIFEVSGTTYKVSCKFGDAFQLSSAGLNASKDLIKTALQDYMKSNSKNLQQCIDLIQAIDDLQKQTKGAKKILQSVAKRLLSKNKHTQIMLQNALGASKNPNVDPEYQEIKKAIITEALTGQHTFEGVDSSKIPNYVASENGLSKINADYIKKLLPRTSARIALKGRGKTASMQRLNEITIRIDVK